MILSASLIASTFSRCDLGFWLRAFEVKFYDSYHRSMFINDPVVGYSVTVRDDDLLLKYDDRDDQDTNFFKE